MIKDTLQIVGDILTQNILYLENSTIIYSIVTNDLFIKIAIPLLTIIIVWFLKHLYEKHIAIRPRLFLRLGKPIYSQKLLGYHIGHELTWKHECKLKNNSKHDAYNIEIWEVLLKSSKQIINNRGELKSTFPEHNNIEKNHNIDFKIKTIIRTKPEVLINITEENGERIILHGRKISNPHEKLMPKELNNIRLIIKYENEKGKTFFTKYIKRGDKEANKLKSIRPFLFEKILKN